MTWDSVTPGLPMGSPGGPKRESKFFIFKGRNYYCDGDDLYISNQEEKRWELTPYHQDMDPYLKPEAIAQLRARHIARLQEHHVKAGKNPKVTNLDIFMSELPEVNHHAMQLVRREIGDLAGLARLDAQQPYAQRFNTNFDSRDLAALQKQTDLLTMEPFPGVAGPSTASGTIRESTPRPVNQQNATPQNAVPAPQNLIHGNNPNFGHSLNFNGPRPVITGPPATSNDNTGYAYDSPINGQITAYGHGNMATVTTQGWDVATPPVTNMNNVHTVASPRTTMPAPPAGPAAQASNNRAGVPANEFNHFERVRQRMNTQFHNSPLIPQTFGEWLEQRKDGRNIQTYLMNNRVRGKQEDIIMEDRMQRDPNCRYNSVREAANAIVENDNGQFRLPRNVGAVLGQQTIWTRDRRDNDPFLSGRDVPVWQAAEWPSARELRWEGDDRANSNVGRFLPLPRRRQNDTVAWHHCPYQQPWPFDEVRRVPDYEQIYHPPSPVPAELGRHLLGDDLLVAIKDAHKY